LGSHDEKRQIIDKADIESGLRAAARSVTTACKEWQLAG